MASGTSKDAASDRCDTELKLSQPSVLGISGDYFNGRLSFYLNLDINMMVITDLHIFVVPHRR